jgi:hypothetical protein
VIAVTVSGVVVAAAVVAGVVVYRKRRNNLKCDQRRADGDQAFTLLPA